MASRPYQPESRTWRAKFAGAARGVVLAMRGQSSFAVHAAAATLVVIFAALLQCTIAQWCLLLLCIALVLTAEVFNSALEVLAKAIDAEHNPYLADGLDIASGAVLISALGAALVGSIVLLQALIAALPG